jgi:hypothetical protein
MILRPCDFTHHAPSNTYVTELSDLQLDAPPQALMFAIENDCQPYVFSHVDRTPDGDIAGWNYKPAGYPVTSALILIIND